MKSGMVCAVLFCLMGNMAGAEASGNVDRPIEFAPIDLKTYAKINAEDCEKKWETESSDVSITQIPDLEGLLARWQQSEKQCSGSVVYEARLAMLYALLNRQEKARQALKPYLKEKSKYSYLVELALLQIDEAGLRSKTITESDMEQLEQKYLNFVKKFPEEPAGYAFLGGIQSGLEKHSLAIISLEKALKSTMNLVGVYRHLTISYTSVGRYNDAIKAADEAIKLNRFLTSDQYFVYSLAKSYAATSDFYHAETALRVISAKKPEVRRDLGFKDAVDFVTEKMKSAKNQIKQ